MKSRPEHMMAGNETGKTSKSHRQAQDMVVSVICTAYNHEGYIAKALDGFLMQETSFPFEIIVHDDASTDQTAEIIREYDRHNPGRLKCILQTENQCSKIGSGVFHDIAFSAASGEFIALCEGDDYWTDPNKLEKQVGFMKRYPHLSVSFHATRVDYADGSMRSRIQRYRGGLFVKAEEVILRGGCLNTTCSTMFRRDVFEEYPRFFLDAPVADSMWMLNAITKGDVGYLDDVMAVYNCRVPGSWSDRSAKETIAQKLSYFSQLEIARAKFDSFTNGRFSKWIRIRASLNKRLALVRGAREKGCYGRYRELKSSMLKRDRILFHCGYLYFRSRAWARRAFNRKGQ